MKNEIVKIRHLLSKIDKPKQMKDRQTRLLKLVEQYGYDNVAVATGWTVATILQYCKSSSPIIGLERLDQAEQILKQL